MTRTIDCLKLKKHAPGLARMVYPGELGQKIYDHISAEAWGLWLQHQTMLINEYRLNLSEAKARQFLVDEMKKFLFEEGSNKPTRYTPIK